MSIELSMAKGPRLAQTMVPAGPRVITIASGKGGVGKTHLAVNLAALLGKMGQRVLLVDADLGLANVNVLLGLSPALHAGHLVSGEHSLEDVLTPYRGLFDFLPAGSAMAHLAELELSSQVRLVDALSLHRRNYDLVLVDAGAGIGANVRLALSMADESLVVMNPETTSLTDAYALVKVARKGGYRGPFQVVVNRVRTAADGRGMHASLDAAARSFLDTTVGYAGYVYRDRAVERALRAQTPFVLEFPEAPASRCVEALARSIAGPQTINAPRALPQ